MNFLYLIGNGFDVNLKIRTDYQSFYNYYLAQNSTENVVKLVKEDMKKNRYAQWSDLELGLGKFTSQLKDINELRTVYYDINILLKSYLTEIYNKRIAELDKQDLTTSLINYLIHPDKVFNARAKKSIKNFFITYANSNDVIDIITFNYTYTIEHLLKLKPTPSSLVLGKNIKSLPIKFGNINHIHGKLSDNDLILGVNDVSQIANEDFRSMEMASFLMVKPSITEERGDLLDDNCERLITYANLIALFGLSIGETDNKWWDIISRRMRSEVHCIVLYYAYDNNNYTHDADIFHHQSELKNVILSKLGLKNISGMANRVFVAYKSGMFDLII